jgi:5-methylcytosine-specific restriction endonuclease McrA
MACAAEYKRGKPLPEHHKAALSKAKIGKPIKHLMDDWENVCDKISTALRGKPQPWNRGELHPNYVDGGKAAWARQKDMGRAEYKEWRRQVFERDGFACVKCGEKGKRIQADHIKPYALFPESRYDVENGRTLCKKCHKETETYAGKIKSYAKRIAATNQIHSDQLAQTTPGEPTHN